MDTSATRRRFLKAACAATYAAWVGVDTFALASQSGSGPASQLAQDPRRPQFHLLPTHNWMNDPNGPIYFAGKYHMFFQYNPEAAVWGNMSWNHAVSDDMLHWRNYPVAFTMTPGTADAVGCFSGSAMADEHGGKPRVYAIYTGIVRDKAHETIRNGGTRESQCLAWSDDPMLRDWTKLPRSVIPNPPSDFKVTGFRDPSMWKQDRSYFMTVGSGIEKVGGCVLLYRSTNLMEWEYLHPLVTGTWNGVYTSNPVDDGEMWECPEFFRLDNGHVLIYSTMGKVFWQSGSLDQSTMKFEPKKSGLLDLDAFYAPKTQLDAQGHRILWGWIPERRNDAEMTKAGWSGMMSLPRVLHLDPDGTLRMQVLPQIESLRGDSILPEKGKTESVVPRATGEVLCVGKKGSSLEFCACMGTTELVRVSYSAEKHSWVANGQSYPLQPSDVPKVHAFIDGSVIELILSERIGYTKRFYYSGVVAPDIAIRASGAGVTLKAWKISPISTDRLTTIGPLA
jgi:beta-fructofuranosidase